MKRLILVLLLTSLACGQAVTAPQKISAVPAVTADPIPTLTKTPEVWTVCAWTLNVRDGWGTSHAVIGAKTRGELVNVLRFLNGWAEIERGQWVNVNYLRRVGCE